MRLTDLPASHIVRRVVEEGPGSINGVGVALGVAATAVRRWAFVVGHIPGSYALAVEEITAGRVTALEVLVEERKHAERGWKNWVYATYRRDHEQFRLFNA